MFIGVFNVMVFSSVLFLFYFLVPTIFIYAVVPGQWKNFTLFVLSLIFYAWGEPKYITLMLFSAIFNYGMGFVLDKSKNKGAMAFTVAVNIGLLFIFKYSDFFISSVNSVIRTNIPLLKLALPVGISFYTFQALSYCIDVYRGKTKLQRSFVSFGLYLTFFPQLIAGPIVRYDDIAEQLPHHPQKIHMFSEGLYRFCAGLAKKVLIANNVGKLWEITNGGGHISMLSAWLGIAAYTFQIYYDFSGYSDMAIGLGKMFGFEFCENFNYPYISKSITEFWRRWHISLSSWFKEYVYIPLGGSRVYAEDYEGKKPFLGIKLSNEKRAVIRRYTNLLIVWLLTGMWHGASFNFLAWGLYYGILLIIEKRFIGEKIDKWPSFVKHIYSMVIVMIGWVLFASENFTAAFAYIGHMFNVTDFGITDNLFLYRLFSYAIIFICAIIGATPGPKKFFNNLTKGKLFWLKPLLSFIIMFVCIAYLVDDTYNPFLYFRF